MHNTFSIVDLRRELGLTQSEFAVLLGLSEGGKPTVSLWETGAREVSFEAALKIEELSGNRIDAADLNKQVARARATNGAAGGAADHGDAGSGACMAASNGKAAADSGEGLAA